MPTKFRIAIVGCGTIGKTHAEAITHLTEAKLVAVADAFAANAQKFARNYGCNAYCDYRQMFDHEKIDMISVCTPSGSRVEVCQAAAAKGIHILVEKPLEITYEKTKQIIAAAKTGGIKLGCIFQLRFLPIYQYLKQAVTEGRFGRLVLGEAATQCYRSADYYQSSNWRGTWAKEGGGALMNQGIHNVDLLRWLMGEVASVSAYFSTLTHQIEVEDTVVASLQFRSGAMGTITASTSVYQGLNKRLAILGSEGAAIIEAEEPITWNFQQPWITKDDLIQKQNGVHRSPDPANPIIEDLWGHQQQILDMIGAVRDDRLPAITGEDGQKSVELVLAIYQSARTGKPVGLPLAAD
jgi:UDP-N-acetyl-2-amino-2-deoxyglucuronate dehydrogenase